MTTTRTTITTSAWNTDTQCWETIATEPAGGLTNLDGAELTAEDFGGVAGQTYRVALLANGTEIEAREIIAGPVTLVDLEELARDLDVTRETVDTLAGQLTDDPALYDETSGRVTEAGAELITDHVASGVGVVLDDLAAEFADAANSIEDGKERRVVAVRAARTAGASWRQIADAFGLTREHARRIAGEDR